MLFSNLKEAELYVDKLLHLKKQFQISNPTKQYIPLYGVHDNYTVYFDDDVSVGKYTSVDFYGDVNNLFRRMYFHKPKSEIITFQYSTSHEDNGLISMPSELTDELIFQYSTIYDTNEMDAIFLNYALRKREDSPAFIAFSPYGLKKLEIYISLINLCDDLRSS